PWVVFGFVIFLKFILDLFFGRLEKRREETACLIHGSEEGIGPDQTPVGTVELWRMSLMRTLMPVKQLHKMTEMMGSHYEGTSMAMRLLGAKVGERVYWPGTGPSMGDYHLIEVGDDVVFGSRSHIVTSDSLGSE